MVFHVEAINHVVLDVLKAFTLILLDITFEVACIIMEQEVSRNQGHREHLLKEVNLIFIPLIDTLNRSLSG